MSAGKSERTSRGFLPGAKALAVVLRKVAAPALRRQGFFEAGVVTDWPTIVGDYLARHCSPEKLSWPRGRVGEATLELRADGAFAPELQHLAPQIIERVNSYFGFAAVANLRIIQGPRAAGHAAGPAPRALTAAEEAALESGVAGVESSGLRAALKALGKAILTRGNMASEAKQKIR